ncbi:unnamed protein product [Staurois parvus]|uniref:Uncharacterized protein n=1 Tax=Staurois parvus TaxID=386267 RepID=A0ABN9GM50_9NEOB|nr:unnamed protein product [Staurois parvus]
MMFYRMFLYWRSRVPHVNKVQSQKMPAQMSYQLRLNPNHQKLKDYVLLELIYLLNLSSVQMMEPLSF